MILEKTGQLETIENLGMHGHTPHDARHTFSMLCEKFHVNENDRKRMLGHSFSDITNKVYGHRTVTKLFENHVNTWFFNTFLVKLLR